MNLLTATQLSVHIGRLEICTGLDLVLQSGQSWALLGGNGVGKTTLLHTLAGLRRRQAGSVAIGGLELERWDRKALAREVGVLFQDSRDTFPGTVLETALAGRYPYLPFWALGGRQDLEMAERALAEMELDGMGGRSISTLSGGERRRLALATLLVQDPRIWLLDEPSNHLDLRHQVALLERVHRQVQDRKGVLLMTLHDVNLALRFCTHAMLMPGGGDLLCGPVAEVINPSTLENLYRHPVDCVRGPGGRMIYFAA